ncbi:MAG: MqnA/MqnD/SBP family protein, partial [Planctomycetota bacterium]
KLEVLPLPRNVYPSDAEAILLIGDKVVTNRPIGYEFETDLGSAWRSLTSLPFVFAVWAARQTADVDWLAPRLSEARDRGVASAEGIAEELGPVMGWPVMLAKRYLTTRIRFTLGPRQKEGIAMFSHLAGRYDLIPATRELVFA